MPNSESGFTPDHINILLAQMLRSGGIIDATIMAAITGTHLPNKEIGGTATQAILFDIIRKHYSEHSVPPDDAVLTSELNGYVNRFFKRAGTAEKVKDEFRQFLSFKNIVDERSQGTARKIINRISQICVYSPAMRDLAEKAYADPLGGHGTKFKELEVKQSSLGGGLSVCGLANLDMEEVGERVLTGIPWLDARTGNGTGVVNGCTIGIIAPQNSGKTSLGVQMAVSQALMDKPSLLALAEEGLTKSMVNKIFGCALGIDYTLLETREIHQAAMESGIDEETFARKMAMINANLHVYDMVKKNTVSGGAKAIISEIEYMRSCSKTPAYVYVDWAGIIADGVSQITGRSKNDEIATLCNELSAAAQRMNCNIAISQQMATDIVRKGPFWAPDMYCAADCRMFCQVMKYAFAINKQDPTTGYSLLTFVKSRDDGILGQQAVMKLRGELATFFDVSNEWEQRGKRFVRKKRNKDDGKVPSERPRKPSTEEVE